MPTPQTFQQRVYEISQLIPPGKVLTYGQLAKMAGSAKAARAVGMCMRNNPDNTKIPCHRVVAADGKLTGYAFGGLRSKKELLLKEGVFFLNDRVDLKRSLWQPDLEI